MNTNLSLLCFLSTILCFSAFTGSAIDTITSGQVLRDGQTLNSSSNRFVLGFFSPQDSTFRYVGIWYQGVSSDGVVWVANREQPITGNTGTFAIGTDGNLVVADGNGTRVWSSNVTVVGSSNVTATILDSGNLVLRDGTNLNREFWESFDFPTDTYLPDMHANISSTGGERRIFSSWRTISDPGQGNYSMGVDARGWPQIVLWAGQNRWWRSGHWNGREFIGVPTVRFNILFGFRLLGEGDGRYFVYTPNGTDFIRFKMHLDGLERQERWNGSEWAVLQTSPATECDRYNHCGANAQCNQASATRCSCLEGFVERDTQEWNRGIYTGGCIRRRDLQCASDGFLRLDNVKLPDFIDYTGPENETACESRCLLNCSCTAYAFVSGLNCIMWYQDLIDIQQFANGGSTLFVREARSELGNNGNQSQRTRNIIIIVVTVSAFLICISFWVIWKQRRSCRDIFHVHEVPPKVGPSGEFSTGYSGQDDFSHDIAAGSDLAVFSLNDIMVATDDFAFKNKLGEGGFGIVFKGTLKGEQEIAVKRLSVKSGQGIEEFKNEILVIAQLQHRNLVKLLGCCVEGDERMVLYEYLPNKSLDFFLFDDDKKAELDWAKRFSIIEGIARGLVYLHRDSRLRIIHRDLKAGNILLDEEMMPKISDFGMAKIFGGNQNEDNTNRVVGTYGYMAPEYAMEGLFSLKSDVYSFGVLLLEIITGKRNITFRTTEDTSIIAYAWGLFSEGKGIELADSSMAETYCKEQLVKCVHIAMLCVQDNPANRPNMQTVVLMLESEHLNMPTPNQPTFTSMRNNIVDTDMWNGIIDVSSSNVTMSVVIGR